MDSIMGKGEPKAFFSKASSPHVAQECEPLTEKNRQIPGVVSSQSPDTVLTITSFGPPIRDHLVWSIFNMAYLNICCLGLLALVFSIKSRDRKLNGDFESQVTRIRYDPHQTGRYCFCILKNIYNVLPDEEAGATIRSFEPPTLIKNHLMWSIFNTLYLNTFCLGLVAVLFSVKIAVSVLGRRAHGRSLGSERPHIHKVINFIRIQCLMGEMPCINWKAEVPGFLKWLLEISAVRLCMLEWKRTLRKARSQSVISVKAMDNSEHNKNSYFTREYAPQGTYPYLPLNEERNPVMEVNQSHTTVVSIQPNNVPVRDHLVWSIFNTAYLNACCLGLLALVFSVKQAETSAFVHSAPNYPFLTEIA
ncbi:interferon-induced transmembrane 5 [Pelobates cultripes]|uniref:Interferon-induced transmembrane 5 n=1 Tax=Pelobates cultripes TaxID=61616 RepID=A0AAD1TLJ9_PELCU|nr:interferon-induced transmembrane 5 [Pelobates cultripes]